MIPLHPRLMPCALKYHASLLSATAGAFKTVVLREGNSIVCAATVRTFGTILAEIPFIGTKEDCRHGISFLAVQVWEHCLLWYSDYLPSNQCVNTPSYGVGIKGPSGHCLQQSRSFFQNSE